MREKSAIYFFKAKEKIIKDLKIFNEISLKTKQCKNLSYKFYLLLYRKNVQ